LYWKYKNSLVDACSIWQENVKHGHSLGLDNSLFFDLFFDHSVISPSGRWTKNKQIYVEKYMDSQHVSTLHKLFILATGRAATTEEFKEYAALIGPDGDFSAINQLIDAYLTNFEQLSDSTSVLLLVVQWGLGITSSPEDAQQVLGSLQEQGYTSWSSIFHWVLNNEYEPGAIIANRAEGAQFFNEQLVLANKSHLFDGLNVKAAVANLIQGIGVSSRTLNLAKDGLLALTEGLSDSGITSIVIDGYISGATVFADANGNGVLDPGEWSAITDEAGNYTLPTDAPSGKIIASGGTDILTGQPFQGVLTAPAGSTVVNPITTLVQSLVESGSTVEEASSTIQKGLGLSDDINPLSYDPLKDLANPNASAEAKAKALSVQKIALQVSNVVSQVGNASKSLSGDGSLEGFGQSASKQLANLIKTSVANGGDTPTPVKLGDSTTIKQIVTSTLTC